MGLVSKPGTFPALERERGIHERRTGTGHRGLREVLGAGEKEMAVAAALVLHATQGLCCQDQEEGAEDLRGMFRKMLYFVRPIARTGLPTFVGREFPR